MFTSITLDDATGSAVTLHATASRKLRRATGLISIPPPRQVVRTRPSAHGSINETHWTEGRLISLEGYVVGTDAATAFTELRALQDAMLDTLDTGAALLKWTEAGATGLSLQASVKLASDVDPVLDPYPYIINYQVQLLADDPRAYSQTLTTSTGGTLSISGGGDIYPDVYPTTYTVSGDGTSAVNNTGTRPTPPVFRIYGQVTNPTIINLTTLDTISLTGSIAAGDYMELDTQTRTVKLNGSTSQLNFLNPATTTWFELPPGTTTLRLIAESFDANARLDVLYRAAYT